MVADPVRRLQLRLQPLRAPSRDEPPRPQIDLKKHEGTASYTIAGGFKTEEGGSHEPNGTWTTTTDRDTAHAIGAGLRAGLEREPSCLLYTSDAADDLLCVDL